MEGDLSINKLDPFTTSGSEVMEGVGSYLFTSVGVHGSYGKFITASTEDTQATPPMGPVHAACRADSVAGRPFL
jgi:Ca2+-transporting ATPase